MSLKGSWAMTELSTQWFVVFFVGDPAQKVQAMQMMEDLHTNSVAFFSSDRMVDLE